MGVEPFVEEIVELHKSGNVTGILKTIQSVIESEDKSLIPSLHLLTWPAPTELDLNSFSAFLRDNLIAHIYSIGCGTGLLEWLIAKSSMENAGHEVGITCIEIDFGWWSSPYAPPMFLPLVFIDKNFNGEEPFGKSSDLALFCYFNNLKVFLDYLALFRGHFVAILGPISNTQFCAPAPLELVENEEMPRSEWQMVWFTPFGLGNVDHLAIYKKVVP